VILAAIQAKMDSTRLPGKVMLPLLEKPVIYRIFERLKFSRKLDEICISTSIDSSDDIIANYAKENGIKCFRGSDKNLVDRHLSAAKFFNADVIVRITSDCPVIDPTIVDELLEIYNKNPSVDFLSNTKVRTYPVGLDVEVMPKKTLERLMKISESQEFYEFFISNYIYKNPKDFTSIGIQLKNPNVLRWTLDHPEDYEFIKKIYSNLYKPGNIFLMNDIFELLQKKPELGEINSKYYSDFSHLKYEKFVKNKKNHDQ
jgi:spore coat polysaccharide biosynthesis protein SpsF